MNLNKLKHLIKDSFSKHNNCTVEVYPSLLDRLQNIRFSIGADFQTDRRYLQKQGRQQDSA